MNWNTEVEESQGEEGKFRRHSQFAVHLPELLQARCLVGQHLDFYGIFIGTLLLIRRRAH